MRPGTTRPGPGSIASESFAMAPNDTSVDDLRSCERKQVAPLAEPDSLRDDIPGDLRQAVMADLRAFEEQPQCLIDRAVDLHAHNPLRLSHQRASIPHRHSSSMRRSDSTDKDPATSRGRRDMRALDTGPGLRSMSCDSISPSRCNARSTRAPELGCVLSTQLGVRYKALLAAA
jgi:hypothetical protein